MNIRKNVALSDSGLVFNPVNGESFSVNPIGMEIIRLIREGKTKKEMTGHLLGMYATDQATAEKDIQDFLLVLKNYALLEDEEEKKD